MKAHPSRIIKFVVALFFLAVLILIIHNLVARSQRKIKAPIIAEDIKQQKVEETESLKYVQNSEGERDFELSADRHRIREDNLYHLEGNVRLTFPRGENGENVYVYANEMIHDKGLSYFNFNGKTKLKFKDLTIESENLEYDAEKEIIRTEKPVQFSSNRYSGIGTSAIFRLKQERVKFSGGFHMQLALNIDPEEPLYIDAEELDYRHKKAQGTLKGDVKLTYGKNQAQAEFMEFELYPDKENLRSLHMLGQVSVDLVSEKETPQSQAIKANELMVRTFNNSQDVRSIAAKGECYFFQITEDENSSEIRAQLMDMTLNRKGEIKTFHALQNATLMEEREGQKRWIQGQTMIIKKRKNALQVEGEKGSKARIKTDAYEIAAESLNILTDSKNLEAVGGVNVIMRPKQDQKSAVGFFSGEGAVYINAGEMRYLDENKRFLFTDKVKVWQGKDSLSTSELILLRDTGTIRCREGVSTLFSYISKEEREHKVEISAQTLEFKPEEHLIVYDEGVLTQVEDLDLQTGTLSVYLDPADNKMLTMAARGDVIIRKNQYEGRGEAADFDLEKETLALTGNPVLTHKERGKIEGDKLTFHIADDRIIVENKGRERSETVIKS